MSFSSNIFIRVSSRDFRPKTTRIGTYSFTLACDLHAMTVSYWLIALNCNNTLRHCAYVSQLTGMGSNHVWLLSARTRSEESSFLNIHILIEFSLFDRSIPNLLKLGYPLRPTYLQTTTKNNHCQLYRNLV